MFRALLIIISLLYIMPHAQAATSEPTFPHRMIGSVNVIDTKNNRTMTIQYSDSYPDLFSCNNAIGLIVRQVPTSSSTNYGPFDKVVHLICMPEQFFP